MDNLIKVPTSAELIEMLTKAQETYEVRPVKVEINDKNYIVNDLKMSAHDRDFTLFLSTNEGGYSNDCLH